LKGLTTSALSFYLRILFREGTLVRLNNEKAQFPYFPPAYWTLTSTIINTERTILVSTYLFFYRAMYLYSKLPLVPQVPCRNQGPIRGAKERRRGCFWCAQTNLLLGHAGDFPRGWRHTTQSAQQRNRLLLIFPSPPH
jgi:hypothetical protein